MTAGARAVVGGLVVLVAGGLAARWWAVRDRPLPGYAENADAAAHVLLTSRAFAETPAAAHRFLPLVTLGGPADRGVNDFPGSAAADPAGRYYYTSFPPLGFLAPHLAALAAGKPYLTPNALRRFTLGLHLAVLAAAVAVFYVAAAELAHSRSTRVVAAAAGGAVVWAAPEMVASYSLTYWGHHLYQLVFVLQLLCLCTGRVGAHFALLAAAGCLTEWTGFVGNAGIAAYGAARYVAAGDRRGLLAAVLAVGGTLAGLAALVGWFVSVVPPAEYLANLTGRYAVRRGGTGVGLPDLIAGYVRSVGPFLAVAALAGWAAGRVFLDPQWYDRRVVAALAKYPRTVAVLGLSTWVLVENAVLLEHAVVYSFARVKFAFLLAACATALTAWSGSRVLAAGLLAAGAVSLAQFVAAARPPTPAARAWLHMDEYLGGVVRSAAPVGDELVFMTGTVRGSRAYYAGRNMVELEPAAGDPAPPVAGRLHEVLRRAREAGARTAVVVVVPPDLPAAQKIHQFPDAPRVYTVDVETGGCRPVEELPPAESPR